MLWHLPSNREYRRLVGQESDVHTLDFSPDGTLLASTSEDSMTLVWDLLQPASWITVETSGKLEPKRLEQLWQDLASNNPVTAAAAMRTLSASPNDSMSLFRQNLKVDTASKALARLIADLDSNDFSTRQAATNKLREQGPRVERSLRLALAAARTAESKRRLEQILDELKDPISERIAPLDGEPLRRLRAIRVLERIGNDEARKLLDKFARGAPGDRATLDASLSLKYMSKKPSD